MEDKQRTLRQNKALHLWMEMLSSALNDSGLSMLKTLKPQAEIPWTPITVKELLLKEMMKAMYHKTRTRDLTTKELTEVCEVLTRHLAEKFGLFVDFPSLESLLAEKDSI